jgi:maltose O-acetyltransferase
MSLRDRLFETPGQRLGWTALSRAGSKLARALRGEVEILDPSKAVAEAASTALPAMTFSRTRTLLLKAAGYRLGEGSLVLGGLRLTGRGDHRTLFSIGAQSMITGPLHVDLEAAVHIGDHVYIGHDVSLLTVDHEIGHAGHRCGKHDRMPIFIRDGAWIGARVTVLPGVTIGAGAVVAAGAVVTRDVPEHTLVAGVPARVVRELPMEGIPASARKRHRRGPFVEMSARQQRGDLVGEGQAGGQPRGLDAEEIDQPRHAMVSRALYDEVLRRGPRWPQLGADAGVARLQRTRR